MLPPSDAVVGCVPHECHPRIGFVEHQKLFIMYRTVRTAFRTTRRAFSFVQNQNVVFATNTYVFCISAYSVRIAQLALLAARLVVRRAAPGACSAQKLPSARRSSCTLAEPIPRIGADGDFSFACFSTATSFSTAARAFSAADCAVLFTLPWTDEDVLIREQS